MLLLVLTRGLKRTRKLSLKFSLKILLVDLAESPVDVEAVIGDHIRDSRGVALRALEFVRVAIALHIRMLAGVPGGILFLFKKILHLPPITTTQLCRSPPTSDNDKQLCSSASDYYIISSVLRMNIVGPPTNAGRLSCP